MWICPHLWLIEHFWFQWETFGQMELKFHAVSHKDLF